METPPFFSSIAGKVKEENEYCTIDAVNLTIVGTNPTAEKE